MSSNNWIFFGDYQRFYNWCSSERIWWCE